MLSLYLHIPFCAQKCEYCSFFVVPEDAANPEQLSSLKQRYLEQLTKEIIATAANYQGVRIKTIYFGGGTPFQIWKEGLFHLLDTIVQHRECEYLEEVSFELNPDPTDQVLAFVEEAGRRYAQLYRLRFSFGIQSFDNSVLQEAKRRYTYEELVPFLRELARIKKLHMVYNADFIAFGKTSTASAKTPVLRDEEKHNFFYKFAHSHTMDGFSLYALELSEWSERFNQNRHARPDQKRGTNDDALMDEFHLLKKIITNAGYKRYELSNFALPSKRSIHNMVYRTMHSYLGLWINASSFLRPSLITDGMQTRLQLSDSTTRESSQWVRFQNTHQRKAYLQGEWTDPATVQVLDQDTFDTEQLFLGLRTDHGIHHLTNYTHLLVPNRETLLTERQQQGLITYVDDRLKVTDQGYDVYNHLITSLLQTI